MLFWAFSNPREHALAAFCVLLNPQAFSVGELWVQQHVFRRIQGQAGV